MILVIFLIAYWRTMESAVRIWIGSGTYNYCFMIVPISLLMLWRNRCVFGELRQAADPRGALIAFGASLVWGAASLAGIAELAEFSAIGVLQGGILARFGWPLYRRNTVPFLYLFLMVPTGTALIPALQAVTARIGAFGLDLLAIPVYREGLRLEAPIGDFIVAPGCAGLNFLLAGLAVAIAAGEFNRDSARRRLSIVLAMTIVGILGNGLRVTLIIALAQWTGASSVIDDHLLLGWALFSLLMTAVLIVDSKLAQKKPAAPPATPSAGPAASWTHWLLVPSIAGIPALFSLLAAPATTPSRPLPAFGCGPFPPAASVAGAKLGAFADGGAAIACDTPAGPLQAEIALLDRPVRQIKLAGFERRWADKDWIRLDGDWIEVETPTGPVPVLAERWSDGKTSLTVWSLDRVAGRWRHGGVMTQWADLASDLAGRRHSAVLQLRLAGSQEAATAALRAYFAATPLPEID